MRPLRCIFDNRSESSIVEFRVLCYCVRDLSFVIIFIRNRYECVVDQFIVINALAFKTTAPFHCMPNVSSLSCVTVRIVGIGLLEESQCKPTII